MYQILFKKSAEKELERLPKSAVKRISRAVDDLAENPRPPGSKKLEGQRESLWRIRVGDFQIIYFVEDVIRIVEIRRIGHRKDIYR
ncbi:MAG TPA: type II toxin-antitoxin system mRNA interferase toxin, RelE/StbE family [Cytophagales bacterium]|nr:type II toxin-antitoxin system mRNA interferase toxin, RelE/StbE family [Cytophagales bacterium]